MDRCATQNSAVYVGVIVAGALVGEKGIDRGFDRCLRAAWASCGRTWRRGWSSSEMGEEAIGGGEWAR